jgi:hypothetical protein
MVAQKLYSEKQKNHDTLRKKYRLFRKSNS